MTTGVRVFEFEGREWYKLAEVCSAIGINNVSAARERLPNKSCVLVSREHPLFKAASIDKAGKGGPQKLHFVSRVGLKRLIITSNKPKAITLAEQFGIKTNFKVTYQEARTISRLSKIFKHFYPIHQYCVLGYRVDLYFQKQNIAVECDERSHKGIEKEKADKTRQKIIERELGCKFIRYTPDEPTFDFDELTSFLMRALYKNK